MNYECPCGPRVVRLCPECDGEAKTPTGVRAADLLSERSPLSGGSPCWRCDDGVLPVTTAEAEGYRDYGVITIHTDSPLCTVEHDEA